ncbi:hypothetical protein EDD99_8117 [Streptomyces sp. 846.5]|nr:hypothetical protein [Streptomyces sp. 846.5]TDT93308.1 hypothetical protein EDD99_8117 [Streptomyces sp. 846.5]
MSTTSSPHTAGAVDPETPYVELAVHQCRTCGQYSEVFDVRARPQTAAAAWDRAHYGATGHDRFYLCTAIRQTTRVHRTPR